MNDTTTHLAAILTPAPELDSWRLKQLMYAIENIWRRYQHTTLGACEVDEWSYVSMLAGQRPRPLLWRVAMAMNDRPQMGWNPLTGDPWPEWKEPGEENLQRYQLYFGNALRDEALTILFPLPAGASVMFRPHRVDDAIADVVDAIDRLPVMAELFEVNAGTSNERHGLNRTMSPV
jgi:hypothetical protein